MREKIQIVLQCHNIRITFGFSISQLTLCNAYEPKSLTEKEKDTSLDAKYRVNIFTADFALCNRKKAICLSDSTQTFSQKSDGVMHFLLGRNTQRQTPPTFCPFQFKAVGFWTRVPYADNLQRLKGAYSYFHKTCFCLIFYFSSDGPYSIKSSMPDNAVAPIKVQHICPLITSNLCC